MRDSLSYAKEIMLYNEANARMFVSLIREMDKGFLEFQREHATAGGTAKPDVDPASAAAQKRGTGKRAKSRKSRERPPRGGASKMGR